MVSNVFFLLVNNNKWCPFTNSSALTRVWHWFSCTFVTLRLFLLIKLTHSLFSITYGGKMARSQSTDLVALESQPPSTNVPTPNTSFIAPPAAAAALPLFSVSITPGIVTTTTNAGAGTGTTTTVGGVGSARARTGGPNDNQSTALDNNNFLQPEDTSTDSSSIGGDISIASSDGPINGAGGEPGNQDDNNSTGKPRRRKLHFPFGKKSKSKVTWID